MSADTSAQTQPDHPGQPEDSGLLVIGSWAAVLADLAPTLKEAELRVLLELSRRQLRTPSCVAASGREIANACKLGRRNVQYALDSLAKRNLISTRQGTATQPARHRVNIFDTVRLGGVATTPPPPAQGWLGGVEATPPLASLRRHPGDLTTPPPPDSKGLAAAAASLDLDLTAFALIDRVLSAKVKDHDKDDVTAWRHRLHGYYAKFGRDGAGRPVQSPHPPPDDIVAQFLAIADPRRLEMMMDNLELDAITAHAHQPATRSSLNPFNYAWFITIGLSRVHGIHFQVTRKLRAALRDVKRRPAPPEPEQQPLIDVRELARKVKSL